MIQRTENGIRIALLGVCDPEFQCRSEHVPAADDWTFHSGFLAKVVIPVNGQDQNTVHGALSGLMHTRPSSINPHPHGMILLIIR